MPAGTPTFVPWRERVGVALRLLERRDRPPVSVVIVASSQRSGSTMLCRTLQHSGALGPTYEILNHRTMLRAARWWGVPGVPLLQQVKYSVRFRLRRQKADDLFPFDATSTRRYLLAVARRRLSVDGVFGTKMHGGQFQHVMLRNGLGPDVWGVPVTWVRLRRRDRVAQAVSLAKAQQTGQFSSRGKIRGVARYDAELIRRCLGTIDRSETVWNRYFAEQGISPIDVWYEDLAADPQREVRRVLDALGHPDTPVPPPATERQHDAVNDEWIDRYRRESTDTDPPICQ